jgi:lipoprotein-releasing system permease protein
LKASSFIAKRYFFSKKKKNLIQILSRVSMIGVAIGAMSLIVVLSVFNGLEDLIRSIYASFDPDIKIEATLGKSFVLTDTLKHSIEDVDGVAAVIEVIEDNALITYREKQVLAKIKGVDENYLRLKKLDDFIYTGELKLHENDIDYAILGYGIDYELGSVVGSSYNNMRISYPKRLRAGSTISRSNISRKSIRPGAVFRLEKEYDENYVFVPLQFAKELMDYGDKRTSLEIEVAENASISDVSKSIKNLLGDDFKVLDGDAQHSGLLKALEFEKLFLSIALAFITAVASFNIFFTLSMLAIEKKKDISVLFSIGATKAFVKRIFFKEGALIATVGTISGLLLGLTICVLQQEFGLIKMGMETSVVPAYPIKINPFDFLFVAGAVTVITVLASYRPAHIASKVKIIENLG